MRFLFAAAVIRAERFHGYAYPRTFEEIEEPSYGEYNDGPR
ncbi:hypothetical protein Astex_2800 [Asticcacaulis excentricus CB 48]|uniref:Uncharacterized protein n=1 Tax=Asticcacaulis excentricus (strain ATCC 15261 / DSM 4724 / KCTC 12464 / NCIMB 9791 / VKM B-1370 / CB 48) TaxID=573065 RepID=E8RSG7_ASTEC|nr:hypothetical protein Astex_2800 [Asticcacaulis excentricus CB 48]